MQLIKKGKTVMRKKFYKCSKCENAFLDVLSFKTHMKSHKITKSLQVIINRLDALPSLQTSEKYSEYVQRFGLKEAVVKLRRIDAVPKRKNETITSVSSALGAEEHTGEKNEAINGEHTNLAAIGEANGNHIEPASNADEAGPAAINKNHALRPTVTLHLAAAKSGIGFKCKACGKSFFTLIYLNHHLDLFHKNAADLDSSKSQNGVPEKNPIAEAAQTNTVSNTTASATMPLAKQRKIVRPKRTIECDLCGNRYFSMNRLKYHMKKAHVNDVAHNELDADVEMRSKAESGEDDISDESNFLGFETAKPADMNEARALLPTPSIPNSTNEVSDINQDKEDDQKCGEMPAEKIIFKEVVIKLRRIDQKPKESENIVPVAVTTEAELNADDSLDSSSATAKVDEKKCTKSRNSSADSQIASTYSWSNRSESKTPILCTTSPRLIKLRESGHMTAIPVRYLNFDQPNEHQIDEKSDLKRQNKNESLPLPANLEIASNIEKEKDVVPLVSTDQKDFKISPLETTNAIACTSQESSNEVKLLPAERKSTESNKLFSETQKKSEEKYPALDEQTCRSLPTPSIPPTYQDYVKRFDLKEAVIKLRRIDEKPLPEQVESENESLLTAVGIEQSNLIDLDYLREIEGPSADKGLKRPAKKRRANSNKSEQSISARSQKKNSRSSDLPSITIDLDFDAVADKKELNDNLSERSSSVSSRRSSSRKSFERKKPSIDAKQDQATSNGGKPSDTTRLKKIFGCEICRKRFVSDAIRNEHMDIDHPGRILHLCDFCEHAFMSRVELAAHLVAHEKGEINETATSSIRITFEDITQLKDNIKKHQKQKQSPACQTVDLDDVSDEESTQPPQLENCTPKSPGNESIIEIDLDKDPLANTESEDTEPEQCIIVDLDDEAEVRNEPVKSTEENERLTTRLTANVNPAGLVKPYSCQLCKKAYFSAWMLKYHMESDHSSAELHLCIICGHPFLTLDDLKTHMSVHETIIEPIDAPECITMDVSAYETVTDEATTDEIVTEEIVTDETIVEETIIDEAIEVIDSVAMDNLVCYWCVYTTTDKSAIRAHIEQHMINKDFPQCVLCSKAFRLESTLKKHMESCQHTASNSNRIELTSIAQFQCYWDGCNYTKQNRSSMRMHMKTHMTPLDCEDCPKAFANESDLMEHVKSHASSAFFECNYCLKAFTLPIYLANHLQHEHNELTDAACKCGICKVVFQDIDELRKHMKNHAVNGQTAFKEIECLDCGKPFSYYSELKAHQGTHSGQSPFNCYRCSQGFPVRSQLKIHVKSRTCKGVHVCAVCHKKFATENSLEEHQKVHIQEQVAANEKEDNEILKCHLCLKEFTHNLRFVKHLQFEHPDKSGYKCGICASVFDRPLLLSQHMQTHIEKMFKCNAKGCGKQYALAIQLKRHKRTAHVDNKRFACPHCPYRTAGSEHLKYHIRTHTGEKPFECNVCHRKFTTAGSRNAHILSHTEHRKFKCGICSRKFLSADLLKGHLVSHNDAKPPFKCGICSRLFPIDSQLTTHLQHEHPNKSLAMD